MQQPRRGFRLELIIRLNAVYFLTDAGFVVLEAGHAAEALELLERCAGQVHVLFTDVNMPGDLDGLGLAHLVAERWPWIRVLVTSGRAHPHHTHLPEGSRFVPKPYEAEHVLTHVRDLVTTH